MAKYDVTFVLSAVIVCLLKLTSAHPAMTSEQTPHSVTSSTTLTLDHNQLYKLRMTLTALYYRNDIYLNQVLKKKQVDSSDLMELVNIAQSHFYPALPDDVISDAANCRNIQHVLTTTESVLSGYSTLVKAIPSDCFDYMDLYNLLQSAQVKVLRLMQVQTGAQVDSTPTSSMDVSRTIQVQVSMQKQIGTMMKIVEDLQLCPNN